MAPFDSPNLSENESDHPDGEKPKVELSPTALKKKPVEKKKRRNIGQTEQEHGESSTATEKKQPETAQTDAPDAAQKQSTGEKSQKTMEQELLKAWKDDLRKPYSFLHSNIKCV
jgi:hypothetical protein